MTRWTLMLWLVGCFVAVPMVSGCGDDDDDDDTVGDGDADSDSDSDADADADADADGDGDGDADGNCTDPVPLTLDTATTGDTTGGLGLGDPTCGGSVNQAARAYTLDLPEGGVLTVDVVPDAGFTAVVAVRPDCGDPAGEACGAPENAGEAAQAIYCADAAGSVAVVVDGFGDADFGPQQGSYALTASLGPGCTGDEVCVNGVGCMLPRGDTCAIPGMLTFGEPISDTTVGATDDVTSPCVFEDGGDLTYAFSVASSGVLSYQFAPEAGFGGFVRFSSDCSNPAGELACDPFATAWSTCVAAGDYQLTVDGEDRPWNNEANEGAFTLTADFEACPEGTECRTIGFNVSQCVPVLQGGDACGDSVDLTLGEPVAGTTEGSGDDLRLACGANGAGDVVYGLTAPSAGLLHADLGWEANADLRSACDDGNSSLACGSFFDTCIEAGDYSLIVEGGFGGDGPFVVSTSFTACDDGEICNAGVFPDPCVTVLQGGESCGDRVALPANTMVGGTLVGATDDVTTSCGANGGADTTYSLQLAADGYVELQLPYQQNVDNVVALQSACDDPDSEVACGEGFVNGCMTAGDYTVVIENRGNFGAEPGTYAVSANLETCDEGETCVPFGQRGNHCATALAGGDTCADAVDLPFGTTVVGDTRDATNDEQIGCTFNGAARDVVYHVTAPAAGVLRTSLSTEFPGPGGVAVRSTCDDGGTEVSCGLFDTATCVDAGDYYLVVDGGADRFNQEEGPYTLTASFLACDEGEVCEFGRCMPPLIPEVEPNDDGATAMSIADGDGIDAALEGNRAVDFYAIDLTAGQTLIVDLAGCNFDPVLFVYGDPLPDPLPSENTCNAQNPGGGALACNDDNLGLCSRLEFVAPADGTYYLRVVSFMGNSSGDYPLVIDVL